MHQISSYEEFCNSFSDDIIISTEAELLLFMQDWIIRVEDKIDHGCSQNRNKYGYFQKEEDKHHYSRNREDCIGAKRFSHYFKIGLEKIHVKRKKDEQSKEYRKLERAFEDTFK